MWWDGHHEWLFLKIQKQCSFVSKGLICWELHVILQWMKKNLKCCEVYTSVWLSPDLWLIHLLPCHHVKSVLSAVCTSLCKSKSIFLFPVTPPLDYWSTGRMAQMCTREFLKTTPGMWVQIKSSFFIVEESMFKETDVKSKLSFMHFCRMWPLQTSWQCWRATLRKSKVALEKCWRGKW